MTIFRANQAGRLFPLQVAAPDIEAWLLAKDPTAIGAWNTIGPEEYGRAFTAARTAGADVIDDLYFGIVDTIGRGGTEDDFAKLVTPILRKKGWLEGDEGRIATRVRLIYDTNLRLARANGRWSRYQATKSAFPYLRAITAGDDRVRHPPEDKHSDHRAWAGIILPIDHAFWTRWWPPLGFRCRCGVIQMTRSQLARYKNGITSEAELADREARLGKPIFLSPVAPFRQQIGTMTERGDDPRMPGRPRVDADDEARRGREEFERQQREDMRRKIDETLKRIGLRVPEPPAPPAPEPKRFVSPVNDRVTATTIVVEPRLALQKRLRAEFAKSATDPRYDPVKEFDDRTQGDLGSASFSAAFDDQAVSMVAALKPELDNLAEQIGVPPLRGFKSISGSKHVANQGDGVMALNPSHFNAYATEVGGRGTGAALADIEAKRSDIAARMEPIVARIKDIHAELNLMTDRYNNPLFLPLYDEQSALLKQLKPLRDKDAALWKKANVARRAAQGGVKPATTWKPGDDIKGRPHSIGSYFANGVDQARATLFHEFGHHVHQYLNKSGRRVQRTSSGAPVRNTPPLELEIGRLYAGRISGYGKNPEARNRQASTYATSDAYEWFAENFSLFAMGRRDLVDPVLDELIERIIVRGL